MYHGIIIDQEFTDKAFLESFKVFAKKQDGSWGIYGVEVEDSQLEEAIKNIQENMKVDQPWYTHFYSEASSSAYNDEKLIVVFKNKTFEIAPHESSWEPVKKYGRELNIPEEQLDFWPNRFQDERHYFDKEDFK